MKEYKFRGFDSIGNKGWVYGDLTHNKKVTKEGLEPRVMVGGYEVVPESVGLWTGLKDKKGKEIYKGDIVRIYDCVSGEYSDEVIEFAHGVFGVENWTHKYLTSLSFFINGGSEYSIEVIGNVFQNKELLTNE